MVVILTLCPNYWVTTLTYSILTHSTLLKLLIVIPIKRSGMRNLIYESIIVQFITGRICPSPFIVAPRVGAWIETGECKAFQLVDYLRLRLGVAHKKSPSLT